MTNTSRFRATLAMVMVPVSFVIGSPASAQQTIGTGVSIVETIPNTIKLIGAYKTEAVIEAETINERTPCKPNIPKASIRNGESGTVKLQLLVNVNGFISKAKVLETSGFRDLDRAAMIGFLGCKAKPVLKDGAPAETWIDMQYTFKVIED
jgi:protein TonB